MPTYYYYIAVEIFLQFFSFLKKKRERLFKKRLSSGCCVSIPENKAKNIKNNYKMIKYSPLQVYTIFFSKGIFPLVVAPLFSRARCFTKKLNTQFTININRKKIIKRRKKSCVYIKKLNLISLLCALYGISFTAAACSTTCVVFFDPLEALSLFGIAFLTSSPLAFDLKKNFLTLYVTTMSNNNNFVLFSASFFFILLLF